MAVSFLTAAQRDRYVHLARQQESRRRSLSPTSIKQNA
jgi:hypothetical protein